MYGTRENSTGEAKSNVYVHHIHVNTHMQNQRMQELLSMKPRLHQQLEPNFRKMTTNVCVIITEDR